MTGINEKERREKILRRIKLEILITAMSWAALAVSVWKMELSFWVTIAGITITLLILCWNITMHRMELKYPEVK